MRTQQWKCQCGSEDQQRGGFTAAPCRIDAFCAGWFADKKNGFKSVETVTKGSGTLVSVPLQTGPTRLQFYQEAVNTQLTATDSSMIGCSPGYGDQSGGTFKLT